MLYIIFQHISLQFHSHLIKPLFKHYIPGYEWVGWRNDSMGMAGKPVEMVFEFDSVRNFSSIILHTNNMFSKDVQVIYKLWIIIIIKKTQLPPKNAPQKSAATAVLRHIMRSQGLADDELVSKTREKKKESPVSQFITEYLFA